MKFSFYLLVALSFAVCSEPSFAAPAMRSALCEIKGSVLSVAQRKEYYEPESWRKAWGLPKYIEYTDIEISLSGAEIIEEANMSSCSLESFPKIFQLRNDQKAPDIGACIKAKAIFSGDEFSIGHWLYDVDTLPDHSC